MKTRLKPVGGVMVVLFLAGCNNGHMSVPKTATPEAEVVAPAQKVPVQANETIVRPARESSPAGGTESCDRELKALKKLDARSYAVRRAQFTRLMSGASLYASIRTDVAGGTREAVDAMYRFRTGKLCAEISRDVLDALARQENSIAGGRN
ncbi:TPA: hypothetical protein G8387_003872 [Salmonella enterica]|uniref:Lipoprotein n=1 Tax=Salmonella enterica TaxID=28901 RepID=A0A764KWW1_SALER|nr:hypothetical protein [Salmonella enterica]HAG4941162.1 hypothetical protein [Salmonella enterica]HAG5004692.1 hypothetical protein [Salmonella enterica]